MFDIDFTRAFKELVEVLALAMIGLCVVLVLYSLN